MKRREFITNTALLSSGITFGSILKQNFSMNPDIYKFEIGKFKCTILRDLMFSYKASDYFINADNSTLKNYIKEYNFDPENIKSPFIALLIETQSKKILIDTGSGYSENPITFRGKTIPLKGNLSKLLNETNIDKRSITDVIITHFHPDHIGGVFSDKELNYPNAKFHIHEKEWNYWNSSKSDNENPLFKIFVENNIKPLSNRNLSLIKGNENEFDSGITSILSEGHTPGQISINLNSEGESLLYTSDAFLHPIHIEELDWKTNYDNNHEKSKRTREKLLSIAKTNDSIINSFHFDFPGLGIAEKKSIKWKWNAIK